MALVGLRLVGTKRKPTIMSAAITTNKIQESQRLLIVSKLTKFLDGVAVDRDWHGEVVWQVFLSVNRAL
jgi:hypothetical protein